VTDEERCDAEIREIERLLRSGHPEVTGLCRALVDWNIERKLLNGLSGTDSKTDSNGDSGRAPGASAHQSKRAEAAKCASEMP
jgi:hypothetical protein